MANNYETFGVYVVITFGDEIIVKKEGNSLVLPFSYGEKYETPQKCAKRVIEKIIFKVPKFIKSLPFAERKAIDSVPDYIREGWPKGASTFPNYAFLYSLPTPPDGVSSPFSFMSKKDVQTALNEMESRVINLVGMGD